MEMDTPESLLAAAREQIAGMTASAEASASALAASAARIAELEASAASASAAIEAAKADAAALALENAALKADAKSAELRAAEIVAKAGVSEPVEIKPGSVAQTREELLHAFHAETDPRKRAAIYAKIISA